jgi:hypothetical protein
VHLLSRAHTIAAIGLVALIPLAPLGLASYAKTVGADRGQTVARNLHTFRSVRHPRGARMFGSASYPRYRWDVEGSMVPVVGYRTAFFVRLPRALPPDSIVSHYIVALRGWRTDASDGGASFMRDGVTITVDTTETANGAPRTREYGFYVSQ